MHRTKLQEQVRKNRCRFFSEMKQNRDNKQEEKETKEDGEIEGGFCLALRRFVLEELSRSSTSVLIDRSKKKKKSRNFSFTSFACDVSSK
ncbi:hypothetical protein WH47_12370 [Habropoda laboriosa]|uniref:Uncharacterized protein n=1 Tax=Habropoda laboriosa TaxID=597456 RepID=A0A0L7R7Y4_9HYME|nr:hypothetical protein WH47_12370 [Habropoda laboriosa]